MDFEEAGPQTRKPHGSPGKRCTRSQKCGGRRNDRGMPERDERPWEPCQMNRQELAMGRPCPRRPAPLPSVDMGTRQELAMGTLHMSVQRGNESAVAAGGCLAVAVLDLLTATTRVHGHGHSIASASRAREHDGSRVIRVGLSWSRTPEPRELGLRGFRTLPPPSTGDPNRAQPPVDRPRPDRTRPLGIRHRPAPAPSTR